MRLAEFECVRSRLQHCSTASSWAALCQDHREAQFLAWNFDNDDWFREADAQAIEDAVRLIDNAQSGPELIRELSTHLKRVRTLSAEERGHVPNVGLTHTALSRLGNRFDLAEASAGILGAMNADGTFDDVPTGTTVKLTPRPYSERSWAWVTFNTPEQTVPDDPDDLHRALGLPYKPDQTPVLRIHLPLHSGAPVRDLAIPTLLESPTYACWRARPKAEKLAHEPWGMTRDLMTGEAALPELLADSSATSSVEATVLGLLQTDWSGRAFLAHGPR